MKFYTNEYLKRRFLQKKRLKEIYIIYVKQRYLEWSVLLDAVSMV